MSSRSELESNAQPLVDDISQTPRPSPLPGPFYHGWIPSTLYDSHPCGPRSFFNDLSFENLYNLRLEAETTYSSLLPKPTPSSIAISIRDYTTAFKYLTASPWPFRSIAIQHGLTPARLWHTRDELVRAYCEAALEPICTGLLTTLPRELRDMIYAYILPAAQGPVNINSLSFDQIVLPRSPLRLEELPAGLWPSRDEIWSMPNRDDKYSSFVFDGSVVGEVVRREMIETWYRTRRFEIDGKWASAFAVLEKLATVDRWQTEGLKPADHIVDIHITFYQSVHDGSPIGSIIAAQASLLARFKRARITLWFPGGSILSKGHIVPRKGIFEKVVLRPILEQMHAVLKRLLEAGCRVWLVMDNNPLFRSDMGDELGVDMLRAKIGNFVDLDKL